MLLNFKTSVVGPPQGHKPCQQTCSSMGSSPYGAPGPARSLLQCGLPTGSQTPSGIHLLWRGVLPRLQMCICSSIDLHEPWGDSLPHHGLLHGLQGNLCSSAWSTSSPCSSLTLVFAELFLTPPSLCKCCYAGFFAFLNMLSQRHYHHL